jgi:hypothetical protein
MSPATRKPFGSPGRTVPAGRGQAEITVDVHDRPPTRAREALQTDSETSTAASRLHAHAAPLASPGSRGAGPRAPRSRRAPQRAVRASTSDLAVLRRTRPGNVREPERPTRRHRLPATSSACHCLAPVRGDVPGRAGADQRPTTCASASARPWRPSDVSSSARLRTRTTRPGRPRSWHQPQDAPGKLNRYNRPP